MGPASYRLLYAASGHYSSGMTRRRRGKARKNRFQIAFAVHATHASRGRARGLSHQRSHLTHQRETDETYVPDDPVDDTGDSGGYEPS